MRTFRTNYKVIATKNKKPKSFHVWCFGKRINAINLNDLNVKTYPFDVLNASRKPQTWRLALVAWPTSGSQFAGKVDLEALCLPQGEFQYIERSLIRTLPINKNCGQAGSEKSNGKFRVRFVPHAFGLSSKYSLGTMTLLCYFAPSFSFYSLVKRFSGTD